MKKLIPILAAVFAALALQSCSATFHASHRHPVPPRTVVHVDVRPGHNPHVRKHVRKYRKYARNNRNDRNYRNDRRAGRAGRDYGMRPGAPVPPHAPVPPRRPRH